MMVRELIAELEEFDGEMEVVLGISTRRGPDRAVEVDTLYGDGVKQFIQHIMVKVIITL